MKWHEMEGVPEGSLLVRLGSNRRVFLLEKFGPPIEKIRVRYLDTREVEDRADPKDFDRLKPPPGTVPRTDGSS
ncbi:MAG: hypothetical protein HYV67_00310 [Candidatus Taylorbacteria bacterium]|nr:hypothetical protein [Candidatus Taylorbacteria bacterium]